MEIFVKDGSGTLIAVVDVFESFIWTERYNSYGDFEIYIQASVKAIDTFALVNIISTQETMHTMIVERHELLTDAIDGDKLIVSGRSLESLLERRIIWGQKTLDMNLQDGIEELLNDAIISPTDNDRKVDGFMFLSDYTPAVMALTIKTQFTGTNLYTAIVEILQSENLGFVFITIGNQSAIMIYVGDDKSKDQVINPRLEFSPDFDNIVSSTYIESDTEIKTISLVAGEGEGFDRKMTSVSAVGGSKTGFDRREMFVDARDISQTVDGTTLTDTEYLDLLAQRGKEKISKKVVIKTFDGQVEAGQLYKYGKDYYLGDIVQISNEYGRTSKSRVTEVIRSQSVEGFKIFPTFTKIDE